MARKVEQGAISQNIIWTIKRGSWAIHFLLTFVIWVVLMQVLGSDQAWQLTVILYNAFTFLFFHWIVGDPFNTDYRGFTFWEQMADQLGQTATLKFMALYPTLLFMFVSRIATWSRVYLCLAIISLVLVTVPKFGFMHMKRIFGIQRYD